MYVLPQSKRKKRLKCGNSVGEDCGWPFLPVHRGIVLSQMRSVISSLRRILLPFNTLKFL